MKFEIAISMAITMRIKKRK